jgi:arylsulfatase A-like enzyme
VNAPSRAIPLKVLGIVCALALAGSSCHFRQQPNVLVITVDSLRPDFLSCYAAGHEPTPHFDALAASGVLFAQAVCDVPWTRASMTSVMTGRYASAHRVRSPFDRVAEPSPTLAQAFRMAGYRTGAVVSEFDLDPVFQLNQGFDAYDAHFEAPEVISGEQRVHWPSIFYGDFNYDRQLRRRKLQIDAMRGDAHTSDAAIGWLRRTDARPFFLWVHYFGPHERWHPDGTITEMIGAYQPSVLRSDAEVGRLLDTLHALRLDRNTIVVLHADHGQALMERGGFGHGADLYEEGLRVPLIMRWPEHLPAGKRVDGLVTLVDVFPTLAELAGVPVPAQLDGRSLVALLRGLPATKTRTVYCETYLPALAVVSTTSGPAGKGMRFGYVRRAIRGERWKLIRNDPTALIDAPPGPPLPEELQRSLTSEELYDVEHDPLERNNLVAAEPAVAAELRSRLSQVTPARIPSGEESAGTRRVRSD